MKEPTTKAEALKMIRRLVQKFGVTVAEIGGVGELPNDLITTTAAAKILGVSPRQARHLVAIGDLKAFKQGRDNLVSQAAVEAFQRKPVGNPSFKAEL